MHGASSFSAGPHYRPRGFLGVTKGWNASNVELQEGRGAAGVQVCSAWSLCSSGYGERVTDVLLVARLFGRCTRWIIGCGVLGSPQVWVST